MSNQNIFQYVKENIKISDFVRTLPQTKGLHSVGGNQYRCNNIIADGDGVTSMSIKDDEGYFKMFSHGQEYGDVIKLYQYVMGSTSDSQRDSAISLAGYMGLSIPENLLQTGYSPIPKIMDTLKKICEYSHKYLIESDNEDAVAAREYLHDRKMHDDLRDEWKIGFLPEDLKECEKVLYGIADKEMLQESGMLTGKNGNYIAMRGRLMFPIFSKKGECISFSARKIDGIDCGASNSKYVNSQGTKVYNKSKTLYGQHLMRKGIKKVIICEGNLDVIALNHITDDDTLAVATCGTALSESHLPLLKDMRSDKYTIMFDSDNAGQESTIKLIWMANHLPFVSTSHITSGKDPWDSYINGDDINDFLQFEESIVVTAPKIATQLLKQKVMTNDKFLDWFSRNYKILSFTEDKQKFLKSTIKNSGIRSKTLEYAISGVKSTNRVSKKNDDIVFSKSMTLMYSALLSIDDVEERRFIAYPLLTKKKQYLLEICGSESDIDDNGIAVILGSKNPDYDDIRNEVFKYACSDEEKEEVMYSFCKFMAMMIINHWRKNELPRNSSEYITPLTAISSGYYNQTPVNTLMFLFDTLSLTGTLIE